MFLKIVTKQIIEKKEAKLDLEQKLDIVHDVAHILVDGGMLVTVTPDRKIKVFGVNVTKEFIIESLLATLENAKEL